MRKQSSVRGLLADVLRVREAIGTEPAMHSPAEVERRSYKREESVRSAFSQAEIMIDAAADHLEALDLLIATKEVAIAPWVLARAVLEACANAVWLLDRQIDTKKRVGRSLAIRYEALRSQMIIANVQDDKAQQEIIGNRMNKIENVAVTLGFSRLRDKKDNRTGIALPKPSITELVAMLVRDKNFFRILSGIAHSDYATLSQLFYENVERSPSGGSIKRRAIRHDMQQGLLAETVVAFAKAAWHLVFYYGGNVAEMEAALEDRFTELGLNDSDEIRFWHSPASSISSPPPGGS